MKYLFTLVIVLFAGTLMAQNEGVVNNASQIALAANAGQGAFGATAHFTNPKKGVAGSVHLFKNWKNYAVIITSENQKFSLNED